MGKGRNRHHPLARGQFALLLRNGAPHVSFCSLTLHTFRRAAVCMQIVLAGRWTPVPLQSIQSKCSVFYSPQLNSSWPISSQRYIGCRNLHHDSKATVCFFCAAHSKKANRSPHLPWVLARCLCLKNPIAHPIKTFLMTPHFISNTSTLI